MMKAIALDDEPLALTIITEFCKKVDFIALEKTFTRPTEALKHLRKFPADLIFLDIRMPSMNGLDFYKEVPQDTLVIFTTAHSEYAVEGYNLSAIDYLLKPYEEARFLQAVQKARDYFTFIHKKENASLQHIFIRADYSLIKINLSEIEYIEGLGDYLKIYVDDKKPVVARLTMKAMLDKLPQKDFIRVHRSFIVPFSRINNVRNKIITLGEKEIPIGSSYEEDFFRLFKS